MKIKMRYAHMYIYIYMFTYKHKNITIHSYSCIHKGERALHWASALLEGDQRKGAASFLQRNHQYVLLPRSGPPLRRHSRGRHGSGKNIAGVCGCFCVCMCVYVCVYRYLYNCVHIYIYIYLYNCVYIYRYIYRYI